MEFTCLNNQWEFYLSSAGNINVVNHKRIKTEFCDDNISLAELSVRFAISHPGMSSIANSMSEISHVDDCVKAAAKGPLPSDVFQSLCRNHIWVKNFYYFSNKTVDGKAQPT